MSTEKNSELFLRPRFSIDFKGSQQELVAKFKRSLKDADCKYCSKIVATHVFIDVPKKEDHFWSPQLHLEFEESKDNSSIVKGLFGPKPQIWTLFMFLHFLIGGAFIIFSVIFYTKWSLKSEYTFSLVIMILLPLIWIMMYFLGKKGREIGRPQMNELYHFMIQILEKE